MLTPIPPPPASTRAPRWRAALFLFGPLVVPIIVPFLGAGASISTLLLGPEQARRLWPRFRVATSRAYVVAAFAAFWVPVVLAIAGVDALSHVGWLVLPLCGPRDLFGTVTPPAVAVAVYSVGCFASVRLDAPWVWPIAAAAAVASFEWAWRAVEAAGHGWIC